MNQLPNRSKMNNLYELETSNTECSNSKEEPWPQILWVNIEASKFSPEKLRSGFTCMLDEGEQLKPSAVVKFYV